MSTPPRLSAECYRGFGRFFLTICVEERRPAFALAECVIRTRCELLRTLVDYRFAAIAYCFMPDHFHALLDATTPGGDFRRCVNMFKQRSAFAHKVAAGEKLWQDGYYDRILRDEEATLGVAAYILNNPVRAGLCVDPRSYVYAGSTCWSIDDVWDAIAQTPVTWRPHRWRRP